MSLGSRATPIVLDDIGREFDSTDDETATDTVSTSLDKGGEADDPLYEDDESNICSTVELHERSEEVHIGTRPSATTSTLDGLSGATRWQVNRRFGERSIRCGLY